MAPKPQIPAWLLGLIRGAGSAALFAVISFLADPAHLTFFSGSTALVVSSLALMIEHMIEQKTGNALFGTVRVSDQVSE